jgi:hypothetical protein
MPSVREDRRYPLAMRSAYDVDWAKFPPVRDDPYFPEKVAAAIESLKDITAESESGEPYQTVLTTIANNHGGYLYPASCAAIHSLATSWRCRDGRAQRPSPSLSSWHRSTRLRRSS